MVLQTTGEGSNPSIRAKLGGALRKGLIAVRLSTAATRQFLFPSDEHSGRT